MELNQVYNMFEENLNFFVNCKTGINAI